MKKLLLFTLIFFVYKNSYSQGYKYSVSVGGGVAQSYTDVINSINPKHVFHVNADYMITEYISAGLEFQTGELINGVRDIPPGINLGYFSGYFENTFKELNINTKIRLGQFVDTKNNETLNKLRGLYIGAGIGLITTSQENVTRDFYYPEGDQYYVMEGSDKERMVSVPFSAGIDIYFKNKKLRPFALGFNTQLNFIPNDRLEGYDKNYNKRPDVYGFTSLSVKYRFGDYSIFNVNVFPKRG